MPRKGKEYKYHFIYRTTNIKNSKFYIGMHSTDNLEDGYLGSGDLIRSSIRHYGKLNHVREILEFCSDRESLAKRELDIVNDVLLLNPLCMNLILGGSGGFRHEDQIKGWNLALKEIDRLRKEDKEWMERKSKNLSREIKAGYENGTRTKKYFYDWNGKSHKEESKKLIGNKNSINQKGIKNSQFGSRWVNKNSIDKKIKNGELESFIKDGWNLGRSK